MTPQILVIDDERTLANSIAAYMERHGCAVVVALSGEEGLERAKEANLDLVVVDMKLPGMDGLEVLRRLRERSPTTSVIVMSAYATSHTELEAVKLGAFYLMKPLDLEELRLIANKALANRRETS